jgi:hypothetical protein
MKKVVQLLAGVVPVVAPAADVYDLQEIIDESRLTFARFVGHSDMTWLRLLSASPTTISSSSSASSLA